MCRSNHRAKIAIFRNPAKKTGKTAPRRVLLAMPIGVAAMLMAKFLSLPGDAVYYALAIELLAIILPHKSKP